MTSGLFELAVNIARAHAIPMIALEDKLPKGLRGRRELKQINRIL
jgi:hypothetical protein